MLFKINMYVCAIHTWFFFFSAFFKVKISLSFSFSLSLLSLTSLSDSALLATPSAVLGAVVLVVFPLAATDVVDEVEVPVPVADVAEVGVDTVAVTNAPSILLMFALVALAVFLVLL